MASHITDKTNERVRIGMRVRWSETGFLDRQRVRLWAISKATTIPVNDQNWLPQFSNRPISDDVPEIEYGNENRFVVFTIHSSLHPVQIENLLSEQEAEFANQRLLGILSGTRRSLIRAYGEVSASPRTLVGLLAGPRLSIQSSSPMRK